jgi:hypothetical protein
MLKFRKMILVLGMSGAALLAGNAALAQSTIGDPTPILGSGVYEAGRYAQMNAALGQHARCAKDARCAVQSKQREAEQAQVSGLIKEYSQCKRNAGDRAGSPARKDALREACRAQYQPQFTQACKGGGESIAICARLKRTGSIDR